MHTQWIIEQKSARQSSVGLQYPVIKTMDKRIEFEQIEVSRDQTANSYKMNTDRMRNHHLRPNKFQKKDRVKSFSPELSAADAVVSEQGDVVNEMKDFQQNKRYRK